MRPVKLLCLATLLALLACAVGCERRELLQMDNYSVIQSGGSLNSYCLEGYRYLVYSKERAGGLTQMWEDGPEGPRPMRCAPPPENPVP